LSIYTLGISAFFHDSAACLLKDGRVVVAIQEERLSRKKQDASFPKKSIRMCLESEGINIKDISLVVFYEKPFLKFDRLIDTYAKKTPYGFNSFKKSIKSWTSNKLWIPNIIQSQLNYTGNILFAEHHESHAASSFFASPYKEAAILTIDGVGEQATITIAKGVNNKIRIIKEQRFPHSLGLFYSAFTYYCGFKVNAGEYKLMGLAPYGKPIYKRLIYKHLIAITDDGVLTLNTNYFDFEVGLKMTNTRFHKLFGSPPRTPETNISTFYKDIAASVQVVLEEIVVKLVIATKQVLGLDNLCLAGGIALNCKVNQRLVANNIFKNIWIQPAAGDAGGAIGAAYIGYHHYLKHERIIQDDTPLNNVYLGNSISESEIEKQLIYFKVQYSKLSTEEVIKKTAIHLNNKKIIGWFQGKMEFGPRALGARSILASPKFKDMQKHLNLSIKKREGFRPFAPIVLEDKADEWFDINTPSKYMLFTYDVKKTTIIPSCTHVDNTARVQTVNDNDNKKLYQLLQEFESLSGIPILINTSFNVRGEPIVASIEDALRCFFHTEMDVLVLENYIITKSENKMFNLSSLTNVIYELD